TPASKPEPPRHGPPPPASSTTTAVNRPEPAAGTPGSTATAQRTPIRCPRPSPCRPAPAPTTCRSGCTSTPPKPPRPPSTTPSSTPTTNYAPHKVTVQNTAGTVLATLATYSNLNHNTGYAQHTFSLASYAGQTVKIKFTGAEDYTLQTSFVLDDTAVNVS